MLTKADEGDQSKADHCYILNRGGRGGVYKPPVADVIYDSPLFYAILFKNLFKGLDFETFTFQIIHPLTLTKILYLNFL